MALMDQTRTLFKARRDAYDKTFDRRGRVLSSHRAHIQRRAQWRGAAAARVAQLRRTQFNRDELITVGEELTEITLDLLGQVAPAVAASFQRNLVPIATSALERWPVDTGLSRSLLSLVIKPEGDTRFVGVIGNSVPYLYYIHYAWGGTDKEGKRGTPRGAYIWPLLVRMPFYRAVDVMAREIGDALGD